MEEIKCRGYAGEVPVYCAHDKIVDAADLKPNPRNPNKHPQDQIELLAKIIQAQGWRAPVTVSTRSGLIVRGHGRYEAAMIIGCPCPVDYQHYESDEAEIADLVADNRLAELSEIDTKMLAVGVKVEVWNNNARAAVIYSKRSDAFKPYLEAEREYIGRKQRNAERRNKERRR